MYFGPIYLYTEKKVSKNFHSPRHLASGQVKKVRPINSIPAGRVDDLMGCKKTTLIFRTQKIQIYVYVCIVYTYIYTYQNA